MTAVEFGFVAFIFFMLLLGTVDLGRYQFTQQSLRDIVAEAARAGLITINQALALAPTVTPACPSGGALKTAVTAPINLAPFLTPALLSLTAACTTGAGGVRTITVTGTYQFQFVAPLLPSGTLSMSDGSALSY